MSLNKTILKGIIAALCVASLFAENKDEVTYPRIRKIMKKAFTEVTPLGERYRCPGSGFGEYFQAKGPQDKQIEKYGVGNKMEGKLADGSEFMVLAAYNISLMKRAEEDIDKGIFIGYPPNLYIIIAKNPPGKDWTITVHNEHTDIEKRGMIRRISGKAVLGENQEQVVCHYYSYMQDQEKMGWSGYIIVYDLMTGKRIFSGLGGYMYNFNEDTGQTWEIEFKDQEDAADIITRQKKGSKEIEYYIYNGEKYVLDRIEKKKNKTLQLLGSEREYYGKMLKNPECEEPEGTFEAGEIPEIRKYERHKFTDEELLLTVKAAYPEADSIKHKEKKMYVVLKDNKEKTVYLGNTDKVILKDDSTILVGLVYSHKISLYNYREIAFRNADEGKYVDAYYTIVTRKKDKDVEYYRKVLTRDSVYYGGALHPVIRARTEGIFQISGNSHFVKCNLDGIDGIRWEREQYCFEITNPRLVLKIPTQTKFIVKDPEHDKLLFDGPANTKWMDKDGDMIPEFILYDKVKNRHVYRNEDKPFPVYVYKLKNGVLKYWKHGDITYRKEKDDKKRYSPIAITPEVDINVQVIGKYGDGIPGVEVKYKLVIWHGNIFRPMKQEKQQKEGSGTTDEKGLMSIKGRCSEIEISVNHENYETFRKSYNIFKEPLPEAIRVRLREKKE